MNTRKNLGKIVQSTRKQTGKTQVALSQQTGIHKSTLSEIENGHFTGSLAIYERYLDALDLTLQVIPKQKKLPDWEEIDSLFAEGDE
ncbi:MAG: helix-turn-helix transcriptional regulator [Pasteurella sp.]|nr:helix-turn-helix transcriptional regulator [Pasteurella sp.]